jgi:hypothetical protein
MNVKKIQAYFNKIFFWFETEIKLEDSNKFSISPVSMSYSDLQRYRKEILLSIARNLFSSLVLLKKGKAEYISDLRSI